MSLILEALRKSEAERRRGEAPGLRVELPPLAPQARRSMPAWGWLALAGAAAAAMLAFVLLRGADAASGDVRTEAVAASPSARDTAPPGDRRRNPPAATVPGALDPQPSDAGASSLPRVERIVPPALEPAPEPVPTQSQAAVDAPPGAIRTTNAPDASVTRDPAARVPSLADPLPPSAALRPPSAAEPARTAATTPITPITPRVESPPPAPSPASDLPRVTELPAGQRERLPALKMTMHMWNADPARRFVIVDGRRLVEGDRVGDATVRTIDADGVVLELEGQPLRLPLR